MCEVSFMKFKQIGKTIALCSMTSICSLGMIGCDVVGSGKKSIDVALFNESETIRMSSFMTGAEDKQILYVIQQAPYTDTYTYKTNRFTTLELYDTKGKEIGSLGLYEEKEFDFVQDQKVLTIIKCENPEKDMAFTVKLKENYSLFPYDPQEMVDAEALLKDSKTNVDLSTVSADISYKKREGGIYINDNNPEQLTKQCLHVGLTRNDVSNQKVFFTFEHNNWAHGVNAIHRIPDDFFYYGYQVGNNGTKDIYVTVKNIGYHADGPGSWLGEKEWIDFYNTKFKVKNLENYTDEQLRTFKDYYGFGHNYEDPDYQAITYRIPAGKYIYVMGGTTKDAYHKINVLGTANKKITPASGCSNGAVLFEVHGENAVGAFYAYTDASKIGLDNKTLQGYVMSYEGSSHVFGKQYVGYDECQGVVDAHLTWEFNDTTPSGTNNNNTGNLLVNFKNYYESPLVLGTPYRKLNSTEHINNHKNYWATHINPQTTHDAVGTDMTIYKTINDQGQDIVCGADYLDGYGETANIGNWMIDYMEHYTFVNHGNQEREISVGFNNSGCVAVLVRDQNGKLIPGTEQFTVVTGGGNGYVGIKDPFSYHVKVPAHGYVQFVVEYNLLANSYGYLKHYAVLK